MVAALALPMRWVAWSGGGRESGLQLIEAAAEYRGDNQWDARLALVLLQPRATLRRGAKTTRHAARRVSAMPAVLNPCDPAPVESPLQAERFLAGFRGYGR